MGRKFLTYIFLADQRVTKFFYQSIKQTCMHLKISNSTSIDLNAEDIWTPFEKCIDLNVKEDVEWTLFMNESSIDLKAKDIDGLTPVMKAYD